MSKLLFCILVSAAVAAPKQLTGQKPKSWEHAPVVQQAPRDPDLVSLVAEDRDGEVEGVVFVGPHGGSSHVKAAGTGSASSTLDYPAIARRLNVMNHAHDLEYIKDGVTVELQSINASLEEIRSRFGCC